MTTKRRQTPPDDVALVRQVWDAIERGGLVTLRRGGRVHAALRPLLRSGELRIDFVDDDVIVVVDGAG